MKLAHRHYFERVSSLDIPGLHWDLLELGRFDMDLDLKHMGFVISAAFK